MPGAPQTVILGGGIKKGAPFTVNTLPVITGISPPTVSDSVYKQTANGRSISVGSGSNNGSGNDQIVIGTNSAFTSTIAGGIIIGPNVTTALTAGFVQPIVINADPATTFTNVVAGDILITNSQAGGTVNWAGTGGNILIGNANALPMLSSVVIGAGITQTQNQTGNVLIGAGVFASSGAGGDNTMIGRQAQGVACIRNTGLGSSINFGSVRSDGTILVGYNATCQNGQSNNICIGRQSTLGSLFNAPSIILGGGMTDNVAALGATFILGGSLTVISKMLVGRGQTHTATIGGFTLSCTNGITTNNLDMGAMTIIAPLSTGNAANGHIIFQTGAIAGAGNAQQVATTQFRVLASAGGAGVASVDIANVTNGAAAAVGTLNNAPAAGDPTFWVPIQVNGVVKHIPAW